MRAVLYLNRLNQPQHFINLISEFLHLLELAEFHLLLHFEPDLFRKIHLHLQQAVPELIPHTFNALP